MARSLLGDIPPVDALNPSDRSMARPVGRSVSLVLLAVAAVAAVWRVVQAWRGVDLFSDDAYYYTIIARNFVDTGRFTFDGSSLTNGFHPLLCWLEAAGFAVLGTGSSPMAQYLGVLIGATAVFLLTIGGGLLVAARQARSEADAAIQGALLLTLCVILVPRFTVPFVAGMESVLVLPLLLLVGFLAWKSRYVAAGVCALLLVTARLDTLPYVVLPLGLVCVWRRRSQGWPAVRSGLQVVLPGLLGVSVLMLCNIRQFGHPVPIHGVLKSCFPRINFQGRQIFAGPLDNTTLTIALLAALGGAGLLLRRGKLGGEARGAGLLRDVTADRQLAS